MNHNLLLQQKAAEIFRNTGAIPSENEIQVAQTYKPSVELLVPESKAVSSSANHKQTLQGLFDDLHQIHRLTVATEDKIKQLRLASTSERLRLQSDIDRLQKLVRRLANNQNTRRLITQNVALPHALSTSIDFSGSITLAKQLDKRLPLTDHAIKEYSDGKVHSFSPGKTLDTLPVTFLTQSDGSKTGVVINLQSAGNTIRRIELTSTPCRAEVHDSSGNILLRKRIAGSTTLVMDQNSSDSLQLVLYVYAPLAEIRIEQLALYDIVYDKQGIYISRPVTLTDAGILHVVPDSYSPPNTHVKCYVARDILVDGSFQYRMPNDTIIDTDPRTAHLKRGMFFNPVSGKKTALSLIYAHQHIAGIPKTAEPNWIEIGNEQDIPFYYNCAIKTIKTAFKAGGGSDQEKPLATLSDYLEHSVKLYTGKDAWQFIPHQSLLGISSSHMRQLGIEQGYDRWVSYVVLKDEGLLEINNDDGKLRDIEVRTIESADGVPDTYNMTKSEQVTFSGTLPKGIYQIILYVDAIERDDLATQPATQLTGYTPSINVPATASVMLNPFPASAISGGFDFLDPLSRHNYIRLDGDQLIIPQLRRSKLQDFYHPNFTVNTTTMTEEQLGEFYDITYLSVLPSDEQSEAIFFKAEFSATKSNETPILRGWDIIFKDTI